MYGFEWQIYRGDKRQGLVHKFLLCGHGDLDIPF